MSTDLLHQWPVRPRVLGMIFFAIFLGLSYFAITSESAMGGTAIYVVTLFQMLMLATIVTVYGVAIVVLARD